MSTILVTGSTGNYGTAVINYLLEKNSEHTIIGLARDVEKASSLKNKGAEIRQGNYNDPDSLEKAFEGVDQLLLISSSDVANRSKQHKNVIEAARKTGISHIIYTSFQGKTESPESPIWFVAESHLKTEQWIKEGEFTYTFLKNNIYMDFVPMFLGDQVIDTGTVYIPAGDGKMACLLRDEMAEVTANILLGEGHENKSYLLANSENYSFEEVSSLLTEISGTEIKYISPDVDEYKKTMTDTGVPDEAIGMTVGFAKAIAQGELDETGGEIKRLLGRKPTSLNDFLKKVYG